MAKKGQISLEAVVLLLILISLFAQVTLPLTFWGSATGKATTSIAIAVDTINNLADNINLVGVSGDGARKIIRITVPPNSTDTAISCENIRVFTEIDTYITEGDWPEVDKPTTASGEEIPRLDYIEGTMNYYTYSKDVDFTILDPSDCQSRTIGLVGTGGTRYACIENVDGQIWLNIRKDTLCPWP